MSEMATSIRPVDDRPLIVRHVEQALCEWPPLSTVELIGVAPTTSFIGVQMDPTETEYYPFDAVETALAAESLEATVIGLDTTTETDLPRLILSISHSNVVVTADALTGR
ncbi:hypothetical protein GCM10025298_07320 [Natronobiforma cellulositropha]